MSMLQCNVREHAAGGGAPVMIIELTGTIDTSRSVETLFTMVTRSSAEKMVIHMAGVDYVNSAGFAEMVQLVSAAKQASKQLVFAALTVKVKSVFEGLGGGRIMTLVDSEEAALAHLG